VTERGNGSNNGKPRYRYYIDGYQLPVIDGWAKKIREFGSNVIIIAQTAYSLLGDREKIIASGFDDYIVKPIFPQQLIDKLTKAIRKTES
jgi:CheY-like chemotaxis protein